MKPSATAARLRQPTDGRPLPWRGRPWAVAPVVAALRQRLRGRSSVWVDHNGRTAPCDAGFLAFEGGRYLWFRILDTAVRGMAALMTAHPPRPPGRSAPPDGPVVLVVAVLPDLSHTFIYREMLALLDRQPDARVLCLEHGGDAPIHPEAAALALRTLTVPRHGITRRYLSVLGWMLRAPVRTGRLFGLYGSRRGKIFGKGPLRQPRHPGNGFALADLLRRQRPSHIHVYGSTYPANVVMEAACLLDVPFSISSYVDFDFDYDFKMLADKVRLARFFRVCTAFCATRLGQLLEAPVTERVPVLLYGLDLDHWHARPEPAGTKTILSAARIVEKKGLHLVPPALARLRERGISFRWHVAGDGPELPHLRELVREHGIERETEFLGPVGNDEVRAQLERAHLALLPCVVAADGERDGIPIFLTEAMATGVAAMATPVSGIPEVIRDGDTGFLAEEGNWESLAEALEKVLSDDELRIGVAQRGRQEILATHDVGNSAGELLRRIRSRGPK